MKIFKTILFFIFLISPFCFSQNLTITDLTTLCNKKNWEGVNQNLTAKGWNFFESKRGDSFEYNTITWSFKKDNYSEKAQGWLYLYTLENVPNKIVYSFFNKTSYLLFKNSISPAGFKLIDNKIEDNEIISTYSNSLFQLNISTKKITENDFLDSSKTGYTVIVSKKNTSNQTEKNNLKYEYTITNKNYVEYAQYNPWSRYDVKIDGINYTYGDKIRLKPGKHILKETIINIEDRTESCSEQIEIVLNKYDFDLVFEFNSCACPFFFYQLDSKKIFGGELIRNQNSIEKEKYDSIKINKDYVKAGQLKLIVTEEKPEISYIDHIYLKINDNIIIPINSIDNKTNKLLELNDNEYFIMKQGDRIEVSFKIPETINIVDLKLYSEGYYKTIIN